MAELSYALKTAEARFVMCSPACLDVAVQAGRAAGIHSSRVFLLEGEGGKEGFKTLGELSEMGRAYGEKAQVEVFRIPRGKTNRDVCGFLCFSSGTTGLPKAVSSSFLLLEG